MHNSSCTPAVQLLIALEADHFVAEISRAAGSVKSAFAAPVRKLKLKVQFVPWPRPEFRC
jgi:hypothetical protein